MATFSWVRSSGSYLDPNGWMDSTTGSGPPAGPPGNIDLANLLNAGTASLGGTAAAGQVVVGAGSTLAIGPGGTLDVLGGAQASPSAANPSALLDVAPSARASGLVSVAGVGASLVVDGLGVVGDFGFGTLSIVNGASATIGNGAVGLLLGANSAAGPPFPPLPGSGEVSVAGAGSVLTINGPLQVGASGFGEVDVTGGGEVLTGNVVLATGGIVSVDAVSALRIGGSLSSTPVTTGAVTIAPGHTLSGDGTVKDSVVNDGVISGGGGGIDIAGGVSGNGTLTGVVGIAGAVSAGQTAELAGGALTLADPGAFAGTMSDLQSGQLSILGETVSGGSLIGTFGGTGTLILHGTAGLAAPLLGVTAEPMQVSNDTAGFGGATAVLEPSRAFNAVVVGATLAQLLPASGRVHEAFVPSNGVAAPPMAGALNEFVSFLSNINAANIVVPAGYQAAFGPYLPPVPVTLSDANGHALLVGPTGPFNKTLIATGAADTMVGGGGGPTTFFAAGAGGDSIVGSGSDTIVGGVGNDTVSTQGGTFVLTAAGGLGDYGSLIAPGSGDDLIEANGADTIFSGGGSDTVFAADNTGVGTPGVLAGVGSGTLFFINGIPPSTIIGGNSGTDIVNAGAGGGLYGAGGGDGSVLFAGGGAATLVGVAGGDVLFAGGSAADVLIAGAGNETLSGLGSSGNNTFYGGSGNDLMGGGAGPETFFAGTGSGTMIAGSGADLFAFVNGLAGGTDLIEGFNTAAGDRVTLQNYGADAVQSALASATVAGGSTAITLPDRTTILFQGVTNLTSAAFV